MVSITRAIVHEVPAGKYVPGGESAVRLSAAETILAVPTRRFVEDNMLDFALKSPRHVVQDPGSGSTTPSLALKILTNPKKHFVESSQHIARNLHEAQTGGSPSGIVIVALVQHAGETGLAILKAEHQEGMQLKEVDDHGAAHFDLEHLNELIIGNNSRVYKIALLFAADDGETVVGQMVDQQNGVAFAAFFLGAFLGCRLAENAEIQTKSFVDSALNFANSDDLEPATRARYATALVAYVQSPEQTFAAADFAQRFLAPEDQDSFLSSMPEGIAGGVFTKDMTLVPGHGAGLRLYGQGVVVSASADALDRGALEVISEDDGGTVIRVSGAVRRFGLVNAPKAG
ncbi:MAG: hypothetical protein CVT68_02170 [Actinobacteria bacterium HGW-Actinobacteria-8]|nr:MAG: hypothetical protein CVT68_02170 [Actinobacteria bacterium HGW-Actinobacteria-8]